MGFLDVIGSVVIFGYCGIVFFALYVMGVVMFSMSCEKLVHWEDIREKSHNIETVGDLFKIAFMIIEWVYVLPMRGIINLMTIKIKK